jgi:hypothetical protein
MTTEKKETTIFNETFNQGVVMLLSSSVHLSYYLSRTFKYWGVYIVYDVELPVIEGHFNSLSRCDKINFNFKISKKLTYQWCFLLVTENFIEHSWQKVPSDQGGSALNKSTQIMKWKKHVIIILKNNILKLHWSLIRDREGPS